MKKQETKISKNMQAKKILMFSDENVLPNIIGNLLSVEIKSEFKILMTKDNFQQESEKYEPNLIIITSCHFANLIPKFKASKKTRDIPIVLLSGVLSQEEAKSYGANAFLSKPVDIKILLLIVKDIHHK